MPRLLRGIARTAVIAGTATAVSNRVSRRQATRWGEQEDAAAYQQQQQYAPQQQDAPAPQYAAPQYAAPQDAAPAPDGDPYAKLKELAALKDQGILTEEEFTAEKTKILNQV